MNNHAFEVQSCIEEIIRSRLNIILILLALRRYLDSVALADDADVTLEVALGTRRHVIRVRQQRPLVVELPLCRYISR